MVGKIIWTAILVLFIVLSIVQTRHFNRVAANPSRSAESKWKVFARIWFYMAIMAFIAIVVIWSFGSIKGLISSRNKEAPPQESVSGNSSSVESEEIETVSDNTLPEEEASEDATEEQEKPAAELPPEQEEGVYDDEHAAHLVDWEKTAPAESRTYLPTRDADMTDEEYKSALLVWLQSEELDEAFIPKDLTDEEAILFAKDQFGEDFDINAVTFDRGSMPSSTTHRQRTVRERVQSYYNDSQLEGWGDPVLSPEVIDIFWEVYGTKDCHSNEWNDLVAGKTVSAETWKESYDLEIEEDELDFDAFMEIAFWQPMLYSCTHNPVYVDEKAQTLLLIEKEFPGWLDNAPSVKEYVELYDAAMESEDGITNLLCKVEYDDGRYEVCVRPEVVIKGINVYLAYRRLEINAKDPVQAKESTINFHLLPADGNYVRTEALTDPKDQESEPAINLILRYKNRKQAAELGVDVFDLRDIIYIAKKPAASNPPPKKQEDPPKKQEDPPQEETTPQETTTEQTTDNNTTPENPDNPPDNPDNPPDNPDNPPDDNGDPEKNQSEDVNNNSNDETTGKGDGSPGTVQTPATSVNIPKQEEVIQQEEVKEENNETVQTPENNENADVDSGTPPDTSKPEEQPVDNNNSGKGDDKPATSVAPPPL